MVLAWAQWLKDERKKAITHIRSAPKMEQVMQPGHKYSIHSLHETLQHALGYGSWWSVLLIFIIISLGCVAWINAWLVDRIAVFLRRFGILPPNSSADIGLGPDMLDTLLRTASEGNVRMMNKLITLSAGNKAILEAQSSSNELGDTVIHMACRFGHSNIVIALLNAGVSVEVRNRIGETPLAVAAESGHTAVAAVLLSRGANEEVCVTDTALKPIHLAAMFNHVEVARLLISRLPASLNSQESIRLSTPLHVAVGLNHPEMVRFLLDQDGIDISIVDADGNTARQLARNNAEMTAIFDEFSKTNDGGETAKTKNS